VTASATLTAAADLVDGWPEPYAEPLAELLRTEAAHAADLERTDVGWTRYPTGALLLRLAQGVLDDHRQRLRPRICNEPDRHTRPCDCGNRR
jgi:hypothetical protein